MSTKLRFVSEYSKAVVELSAPLFDTGSFAMCMNVRDQHVTSSDLRDIAYALLQMAGDMDAFAESGEIYD